MFPVHAVQLALDPLQALLDVAQRAHELRARHVLVGQRAPGRAVLVQARFAAPAKEMAEKEATIIDELNAVQGVAMDIGGYYRPDAAMAEKAMRPSATLNAIVESLG